MANPWKKMSSAMRKHIEETRFGAYCTLSQTEVKVFADQVEDMHLEIYKEPDGLPVEVIPLEGSGSIYGAVLHGDYHGYYYRFKVNRGNKTAYAVDPWAKSMTANSKLGMILDHERCQPEGYLSHSRPRSIERTEAIFYETHIRDFTVGNETNHRLKGKYLGMVERNTRSPQGDLTGLDHLIALGISHIHILPLHDMGSVDELEGGYNWGYDPMFFLAPEGSYATDAVDGKVRVKEMKAMVQGFHEAGIGVILDVVYNHTFEHEDHPFEILAPGWYFRKDREGLFGNGSGCGNETASESPIFQKYVLDSLEQYLVEYKIDGFRFDLLALHDQSFVEKIERRVKAIHPGAMLYGEPWTGGKSLLPKRLQYRQGNQKGMAFSVFNDHLRNALKGDNDGLKKGFVSGGRGYEMAVAKGIAGGINFTEAIADFTAKPGEAVNYASCHDNLCLYDKLRKVEPEAAEEVIARRSLMALSVVMLSFGTPFLQGGTEILRTKFGDHNSFISGDGINAYQWQLNSVKKAHLEALKSIISLRREMGILSSDDREEIVENLCFVQLASGLIAYVLRFGEVYYFVAHNSGMRTKTLKPALPEGQNEQLWLNCKESQWQSIYNANDFFEDGIDEKPQSKALEGDLEKGSVYDLNLKDLKIKALTTLVLKSSVIK